MERLRSSWKSKRQDLAQDNVDEIYFLTKTVGKVDRQREDEIHSPEPRKVCCQPIGDDDLCDERTSKAHIQ